MPNNNYPVGAAAALACIETGADGRWRSCKSRLEQMMRAERLAHSLGVADESVRMGRVFGGSLDKLALAGLLHDVARELDAGRLLAFAEAEGLITDPAERANPVVLHGPAGALMASREWGVTDTVILESIRLHSTGEAGMSLEACIVFMADLIEPGRAYQGVDILRQLCREDLREAMIEAIEQTFVYLDREQKPLHEGTRRCLAWLKTERGISWKAKS